MISAKLREYLISEHGVDPKVMEGLKDTDSLIETGILDSVSMIKFVLFVEKTFNVKYDLNHINKDNLSTLAGVERYIQEHAR